MLQSLKGFGKLLLLLALSCLVSHPAVAEPLSATRADDLKPRVLVREGHFWILSGDALHRFNPDSESWTETGAAADLPAPPLVGMSIDDENIWIFGRGASVSDHRYGDWLNYGTGEGYPGETVYAVAADEDYAWAGTDAGAARYDRYILEWEELAPPTDPLGPVRDLAVGLERVWFGLDGGVAEFRKETESFRVDLLLGRLVTPRVLALRQSADWLWALTDRGIARYDKRLESWVSFRPGGEFPDSRVHRFEMQGEDLILGTDDGLWRYLAETGLWRRDESSGRMPGSSVRAFATESGRTWVVTEEAFAVHDAAADRWIDFTASVPLKPGHVTRMIRSGETIIFVGRDEIVYGLAGGQTNPSLFTYRSREISSREGDEAATDNWGLALDEGGLQLRSPHDSDLRLKGGSTLYLERGPDDDGFQYERRTDVTLSGRIGEGRTLNGFYDDTDPANPAYQLTWRGTRDDNLRSVSLGEIEQELFNSKLVPGTGLKGGQIRAELGGRSQVTRRRLLTADTWVGKRRTMPGRGVFLGSGHVVTVEHGNLLPGSIRITVDRQLLNPGSDFTAILSSGIVIIYEHILLDDDSVLEVEYRYELDPDLTTDDDPLLAGQLGLAPNDHLFLGGGGITWTDPEGNRRLITDLNSRLEWRGDDHLLRLTPELALDNGVSGSGDRALGVGVQARLRQVELSGSHRNLGGDFNSFEDRRTLLGRLREESRAGGRWRVNGDLGVEMEWDKALSDRPEGYSPQIEGDPGSSAKLGEESALGGTIRYQRKGLPRLELKRSRILTATPGFRQRKLISRAEMEMDTDRSQLQAIGLRSLRIRTFFQRSHRETAGDSTITAHGGGELTTDQAWLRLGGSVGNPLAWNLTGEDRRSYLPVQGDLDQHRYQKVDASLQSRPHSSIDTWFRWEANRDLRWQGGATDGYSVWRQYSTILQFYPGRLHRHLSRLSFYFELGGRDDGLGNSGLAMPGASALFNGGHAHSSRQRRRNEVSEVRLQLRRGIDLIERWERDRSRQAVWGDTDGSRNSYWENRLEIKPRGGQVILRGIIVRRFDEIQVDREHRFSGQWDQIWTQGLLTFISLDGQGAETWGGSVSEQSRTWTPRARITLRRRRWRLDANLSLALTWASVRSTAGGQVDPWRNSREQSLGTSLNILPLKVMNLWLSYSLDRSRDQGGSGGWMLDNRVSMKLQIRA